ncbi:MAG: pyridoxal-dependent decarboxylase [Chloroflexota bacterium]|nr:pyridoxal-dependent decarboxylase [Chloroflexota bacterium]
MTTESPTTTDPAAGDTRELLLRTAELAADFLGSRARRPVPGSLTVDALRASLGGPLPESGASSLEVINRLAADAEGGIVGSAGPRFFGFVIGGSLPAALAADWLTSAWDQNAGLYVAGPAASVVEEIVGRWLIELFGLPEATSFGLTTGCQMAHFTCLAAARSAVLRGAGWDVEAQGLFGAPEIHVLVSAHAHATTLAALQYLGLGRDRVRSLDTDDQGRIRIEALRAGMSAVPPGAPAIVCLQAGDVNSGAFDPIADAIAVVRERPGAWLHVDGAFGLWARAVPSLGHLLEGVELADSWATDAHKWLNVPYDSGIAFVARAEDHANAMSPPHAPYLEYTARQQRDEVHWVPEFSRRARGFPIYAALRTLGRDGVQQLVERCCALARRIAAGVAEEPGVRVLNDVVLNQVLLRFEAQGGAAASDTLTRSVISRVQDDGVIWLSGTTWEGVAAMRISVSNWSTTERDADAATAAILDAVRRVR